MSTCEYIGPDQKEWPYTLCGSKALSGKAYCGEHYWTVYRKGSASAGKRAEKEVEKEIAELALQQEIEEQEAME